LQVAAEEIVRVLGGYSRARLGTDLTDQDQDRKRGVGPLAVAAGGRLRHFQRLSECARHRQASRIAASKTCFMEAPSGARVRKEAAARAQRSAAAHLPVRTDGPS